MREKIVEIYDPTQHRYDKQPPAFVEIEKGHFILANEQEIENYRTTRKMGV